MAGFEMRQRGRDVLMLSPKEKAGGISVSGGMMVELPRLKAAA